MIILRLLLFYFSFSCFVLGSDSLSIGFWNIENLFDLENDPSIRDDEFESHFDKFKPKDQPYRSQISYVKDRPGHDKRYAIDFSLINKELSWKPKTRLIDGLKYTVEWYLNNQEWCRIMLKKSNYKLERIGITK